MVSSGGKGRRMSPSSTKIQLEAIIPHREAGIAGQWMSEVSVQLSGMAAPTNLQPQSLPSSRSCKVSAALL